MGTSLKGKNLLQEGVKSEFFPLRAVPYGIENHFHHIRLPPLNVTIFITHVRSCLMRATPMDRQINTYFDYGRNIHHLTLL